jgi:hypothetical protein
VVPILVGQGFGVGQPGEPVDDRVQVDVATSGAGALGAIGGPVLLTSSSPLGVSGNAGLAVAETEAA